MRQKGNNITLIISILAAIKVICATYNIEFISDEEIAIVANGICAFVSVCGIVVNHFREEITDIQTHD